MNTQTPPILDRRTASQILGVSIRTIDRYIRNGKLFAQIENGRIWLDKKEVTGLNRWQKPIKHTPVDTRQSVTVHKTQTLTKTPDNEFYKDLYAEAKSALQDYQQKLEQSNYRIGQLESQIINLPHPKSVELMDRKETSVSADFLQRELRDRDKEIYVLKDLVKREKSSRIVFAVLTYLLLAIIPLVWYLLR